MRVVISTACQTAKAGNREDECEDRFQLPKNSNRRKKKFRFAVADGATESAFSGLWAQKLVSAYVNINPYKRKPTTTAELYKMVEENAPQWSKEVWAKPLTWFAQEKAQKGAFSTLLGLHLEDKPTLSYDGVWNALGTGDTCVFQIRQDELIASFPIERPEQFNNRPALLSTNPLNNVALLEQPANLEITGTWQSGDRFLIMTDALANWFLNQTSEGKKSWETDLSETAFIFPHQFENWLTELRNAKTIRNDDVTLLMIRVEKDHEISRDG